MVCQFCQKHIGLLRQLVDNQYCCVEHRKRGLARSARALRAMGDYTYNPVDVLRDTDEFAIPAKKKQNSAVSTLTVVGLAGLAVAGLIVMEKAGLGSGNSARDEERESGVTVWMSQLLNKMPLSEGSGRSWEDRFQAGLKGWVPEPGSGGNSWRLDNGLVRPGGLRIWDASRNLGDYTFAFEGRVESSSMGWVVRAANHKNYYATKLAIPERGGMGRSEIVRYSVIQGQESRRQRYPIPLALERNKFYTMEVRAVGDRILTLVGGRVVDQWRDARFPNGGAGFFSEKGDRASIRWARLTEGENFTEKLRSYLTFGLIVPVM